MSSLLAAFTSSAGRLNKNSGKAALRGHTVLSRNRNAFAVQWISDVRWGRGFAASNRRNRAVLKHSQSWGHATAAPVSRLSGLCLRAADAIKPLMSKTCAELKKITHHPTFKAQQLRFMRAKSACLKAGEVFGKRLVAVNNVKSACMFIAVLVISTAGYGAITNVGTDEPLQPQPQPQSQPQPQQTEGYGAFYPQSEMYYHALYGYDDEVHSGIASQGDTGAEYGYEAEGEPGQETVEEPGDGPGQETEGEPGDGPGHEAEGESGDEPGHEAGEEPEEETGEEPAGEGKGRAALPFGVGCAENVLVQEGRRYYTAEELQLGLLRELVELAPAFVAAQEEYGIDAVFLAAVAALESGWGSYPIHGTNLFGFGNMRFSSREAGVEHVASFLKRAYLTEDGRYYRGVSVESVGFYYCPNSPEWPIKVRQIMREIIGRIDYRLEAQRSS